MISLLRKMFRVGLLSLTTLTVFSFQEVSAKELSKAEITCLTAHMTSILKYAVLALSVTLTTTLQAKSINDSSQVQKLSKSQIECLISFINHRL